MEMHLLAQWSKHKFALEHARMWNCQAIALVLAVAIEEDVEIDVPRAFINDLLTSESTFNSLKSVQERFWFQRRFNLSKLVPKETARTGCSYLAYTVQKPILVLYVHWRSLIKCTRA